MTTIYSLFFVKMLGYNYVDYKKPNFKLKFST